MRIMFVTPGMGFGGAERVMSILANKLTEQGEQISFVVMDDDKELAYPLHDGVALHFMQTARFDKHGNLARLIKVLRGHIKNLRPDVIVSFFSTTLAFSWLASFGMGIPLVFSERNDPYHNINGIKAKLYQTIALGCSKHIVFQTAGARDYYGSWVKRKATIILNPFDGRSLPQEHPQKEKLLVSAGRLCEQKNQAVIIDAFQKIADRYPEHRLVIYGEGPLREQLQSRIDNYGLSDRILLPGTDRNLLERIQNAELFLFGSDFEGLPNALIEAMALGLPCVSTDCSPGGARELIDNYKSGIVVPCGNGEKMAEAISFMLDDPQTAKAMGTEARKILDKLSVEAICEKWSKVFTDAMNG